MSQNILSVLRQTHTVRNRLRSRIGNAASEQRARFAELDTELQQAALYGDVGRVRVARENFERLEKHVVIISS